MDFQVYILHSEKHRRYYTGMTSDLAQRLLAHNEARNKSTANGIPWKLVWSSVSLPKTDALSLERKIKKRGAAGFLQDLQNM